MGWGHSLQCYFGLTEAHRTLQSPGNLAIFCVILPRRFIMPHRARLDARPKGGSLGSAGAGVAGRPDGSAGVAGEDDPRTLWVDTDSYGLRRKGWEALINETYHVPFAEHTQTRGPSTVMSTIRYMHENGGDPRKWLDQF